MYNRRYRRSCCMNNNYGNNCDNSMLEDKCQNMNCYCNEYDNNDCECGFDEDAGVFPTNPMLAQSYVPIQYMDRTFKPAIGLKMGTIFPELVSPYVAGQAMEEIAYIQNTNQIGEGCNANYGR